MAPGCGGDGRAGGPEACRLALEAYMAALDRWSFCVRNEVALRKLEARRRLDCLARGEPNCS